MVPDTPPTNSGHTPQSTLRPYSFVDNEIRRAHPALLSAGEVYLLEDLVNGVFLDEPRPLPLPLLKKVAHAVREAFELKPSWRAVPVYATTKQSQDVRFYGWLLAAGSAGSLLGYLLHP